MEGRLAGRPSASGLTAVRARTEELTDTYYDTEDWRFYLAGYALRVRREGRDVEATMKALASAADGVKRRRELTAPLRSGGPKSLKRAPGRLGEGVRALAGTQDLRPLFEIRTRRKIFGLYPDADAPGSVVSGADGVVVDAAGNILPGEEDDATAGEKIAVDASGVIHERGADDIVGEVSLDEAEISGGEEDARLERVEVEVAGDGSRGDEVGEFAVWLREELGLRAAGASKFGMGLTVARLKPAPPPDLGSTEVDASMTAAQVAFAVLRRHFATMLAHEPGVRLGEDPEELHDMRVAIRRLRSALKLYSGFLPQRAARFERDLHHIGDTLGEVRDQDVHLENLAWEASEDGTSSGGIVAALEKRRGEARRRMLEVLDSGRYERLVSGFSGMLRRGRGPATDVPILQAAPDLVLDRYKKARKAAKRLSDDSSPERFHDLRKKGRRLRYALEPLTTIYGDPAEAMVKSLKDLQDDLGGHQDLVVAAGVLRELAVSQRLSPSTVFAMGAMSERYAREAAARRAELVGSRKLRAVSGGKPLKKLRSAMKN